ncbi:hypothetical protein ANANG_G00257990 [Anguilla anguilla]|uniref:TIMELESS-interacting protein n=1 Tax=Anguilla anguilla TaxID=7936 RepID=A0A9D3RKQ4_ANGAN|nr:hypothetical protein ANANG_G00257990 [Anguilla anguilla]
MCSPVEHHHIIVPPRFEDIEDEKYCAPFPPPTSPVYVPFSGKRTRTSRGSDHSLASEEDEKVGGLLLSQMEEKPMANQREPCAALDVDKLLSENGIPALCDVFGNISFKGQGQEVEDLRTLLEGFQHWGKQTFPQLTFEDLVAQLEDLGGRIEMQACLRAPQPGFVRPCAQDERSGLASEGLRPTEDPPQGRKLRTEGQKERPPLGQLTCDVIDKWPTDCRLSTKN